MLAFRSSFLRSNRILRFVLDGLLLSLSVSSPSSAWNSLGHKVVAEIAWRQLEPSTRQQIVEVLRRHPRFDSDFAAKMEDDAQKADKSTQDHWIFQHAATWPDVIRGNKESDRPSWHYIDFPLYLELADEAAFAKKLPANIATDYPGTVPREQYNVLQAIEDCRISLRGKAGPEVKSVAYCWLFHLAGDIHQPLHSTALFNVKRFPKGDHGGNDILVTRGENLHSMWDGFLGRQYYMRSVDKAVAELSDRTLYGDIWDSASRESDPRKWADESHSLCKSFVYSDSILGALHNSQPGKKMTPVELSEAYVKEAGEKSRRRVIAAGIRLAAMLRGLQLESGIAPGRM